MTSRQLDEEGIFHIARQIPVPEARDGYLDQICAGDQALRERVEALLEVHEKKQDFPKSSPEADHTASCFQLLCQSLRNRRICDLFTNSF